MTPNDFVKLLEYIKKNNSWGQEMYDVIEVRHRKAVKYVDACFDSRDGTVFSITMRDVICHGSGEKDVSFRLDAPELVKKVYEWLDEEIPSETVRRSQ